MLMELIERYVKEIEEDLKIDEFSIKEVSLRLPARKHFWVGRLINHKRNLIRLEAEQTEIKKRLIKEAQDCAAIKLSTIVAAQAAESTKEYKEMNMKIADEKLIIEMLEKTEKVFSSMTYDVSNIVKIMQLEQL